MYHGVFIESHSTTCTMDLHTITFYDMYHGVFVVHKSSVVQREPSSTERVASSRTCLVQPAFTQEVACDHSNQLTTTTGLAIIITFIIIIDWCSDILITKTKMFNFSKTKTSIIWKLKLCYCKSSCKLRPFQVRSHVTHSSTSTYIPNFIGIGKTFCGRTYGRTWDPYY